MKKLIGDQGTNLVPRCTVERPWWSERNFMVFDCGPFPLNVMIIAVASGDKLIMADVPRNLDTSYDDTRADFRIWKTPRIGSGFRVWPSKLSFQVRFGLSLSGWQIPTKALPRLLHSSSIHDPAWATLQPLKFVWHRSWTLSDSLNKLEVTLYLVTLNAMSSRSSNNLH